MFQISESIQSKLESQLDGIACDKNLIPICEEFADLVDHLTFEEKEIVFYVVLFYMISTEEGSTRLSLASRAGSLSIEAFFEQFCENLKIAHFERLIADQRIISLMDVPGSKTPFILDKGEIISQKLWQLEQSFMTSFTQFVSRGPRVRSESVNLESLDSVQAQLKLSDEQKKSVHQAFQNRLTIVLGGPGTGKTSVIASLVALFLKTKVDFHQIVLTAPTGKAAKRMDQAISRQTASLFEALDEAVTLHRLLGWKPYIGQFERGENNPLEAEVVIVDEASMIHLELMNQLLISLPEKCQLILVGDANQLPSVGVGSVFREMAQLENITAPLTQNFRVDSSSPSASLISDTSKQVLEASDRVNQSMDMVSYVEDIKSLRKEGVEMIPSNYLDDHLSEYAREYRRSIEENQVTDVFSFDEGGVVSAQFESLCKLFEQASRSKILTATNVLETGSQRINEKIHQLFKGEVNNEVPYVVGEPVIFLVNDYDNNLFNGDQGLVLQSENYGLSVVFEKSGTFHVFPIELLRPHIDLAFAITVHKSQGSEYENVTFVLPHSERRLLRKELIYTALTRSKKSVVIIGDRNVFLKGAEKSFEGRTGVFREQVSYY